MIERNDRIVVTGSGIVCGAGASVETVWSVLESGESAISEITGWDPSNWPVKLGCPVAESNRDLVPERKLHKSISRTDMFGIYAGERAIEQSGLIEYRDTLPEDKKPAFNDRSGIIVGSGGGDLRSNYDFLPLMTESGGDLRQFGAQLNSKVTPMWLLRNLPNNVLCHVGIRAQFKGTNACITNQIAGGLMSVAEAAESIWYGEADRCVAIGHDTILEPETVFYYDKLGLMSRGLPRPFDVSRDGIVLGEGSGAVTLEKAGDAETRGATVLGEILGHGAVTEATGVTEIADTGDGVARAVRLSLENAGVGPSEIGMICAHGNGTPASDSSEAKGLREVFGEDMPPVTSMKWAYGHIIGAAGIADLVMTLESLRRKVVPGIGTLDQIDPVIGDFPVSGDTRPTTSDLGLVVSRGFGGMNVALVVGV